jgi:hypothetical protein
MKKYLTSCACALALTVPGPVLLAETSVHLNLGLGSVLYAPTTPDGTWWQQPFAHNFDTLSLGYKLGANVNYHGWLLGANYVDLGRAKVTALATQSDHDYDLATHSCISNCDTLNYFDVTTRARGWETYTGYKWDTVLAPFLTLGIARFEQHTHAVVTAPGASDPFFNIYSNGHYWAVRSSAGLCYKWVCADTTYYKGVTGQDGAKFPVSQDSFLSTLTLSIPLF